MREPRYCLTMNRQEWKMVIESLNNLRNKLITAGRYTDAVDDVLVKIANAPVRKAKTKHGRYGHGKKFV